MTSFKKQLDKLARPPKAGGKKQVEQVFIPPVSASQEGVTDSLGKLDTLGATPHVTDATPQFFGTRQTDQLILAGYRPYTFDNQISLPASTGVYNINPVGWDYLTIISARGVSSGPVYGGVRIRIDGIDYPAIAGPPIRITGIQELSLRNVFSQTVVIVFVLSRRAPYESVRGLFAERNPSGGSSEGEIEPVHQVPENVFSGGAIWPFRLNRLAVNTQRADFDKTKIQGHVAGFGPTPGQIVIAGIANQIFVITDLEVIHFPGAGTITTADFFLAGPLSEWTFRLMPADGYQGHHFDTEIVVGPAGTALSCNVGQAGAAAPWELIAHGFQRNG